MPMGILSGRNARVQGRIEGRARGRKENKAYYAVNTS
jgi:hypothetical protein